MVTSSSDPEEPVIQQSHMYLLIHLCPKIRIHTGYHFPVRSLFHTGIFPVTWAYPNVNQHFSSKSRSECPSVCPVLFRFQHGDSPLGRLFHGFLNSIHIQPTKIRPEFFIVRGLRTDIMLVGPKNMLVGHEGRTGGESG